MKIGIIGCGLNSDYHINFARAYAGAEIVGVADLDEGKARECSRAYGIQRSFRDLGALVEQSKPEAVSYTHLRAHETPEHLVCRLLLEKKKKEKK